MIYRGPGFLAVIYDSAAIPPPPLSFHVSKLDRRHAHSKTEKESQLADRRGGEGDGRGAESYDRKKLGLL
jgi:hypothetical protein